MSRTENHPANASRHPVLVLAFACVLALTSGVRAGPDLGRVVSRLPASVDFVAALDNGNLLRRQLHGSPLMLGVTALPRASEFVAAWSELATALEMTDAEAFDVLLGQRMLLVGTNFQAVEEDPAWALLSELDPSTVDDLLETLGAVPRRLVRGQPVLELEQGSFLLSTSTGRLKCAADGGFQNVPASHIMLLAPIEDRALFERMLPLLRCEAATRPLADLPVGRALAEWETRDGVVMLRQPDPEGSPHRFFAATIGPEDEKWQLDALLSPADGWLKTMDFSNLPTWVPGELAELPPDPKLAVMGVRETVSSIQGWVDSLINTPLVSLTDPDLDPFLGERSMLGVWFESGLPSLPGTPDSTVLTGSQTPNMRRLAARLHAETPSQLDQWHALRIVPGTPPGETPTPAPNMNSRFVPEREGSDAGWWLTVANPGPQASVPEPATPSEVLPPRAYLHVGSARPSAWALRIRAAMPRILQNVDPERLDGTLGTVFLTEVILVHFRSIEWALWHDQLKNGLRVQIGLELEPIDEMAPQMPMQIPQIPSRVPPGVPNR